MLRYTILKLTLLCEILTLSFSFAQSNVSETILYNGTIYTATGHTAEAIAIRGEKIIAVGTLEEVKRSTSGQATLVDLQGKFLMPGLIDSHIHAIKGGERLLTADTSDELLSIDELKAFAADALQSGRGVRGDALYITGMHSAFWSKTEDLASIFNADPYVHRPVFLLGTDGHTAWCNDEMLKRAGVTSLFLKNLSPSQRRYYGIDRNGNPTGFLSEAAIGHVTQVLPPGSITFYHAAHTGTMHLNQLGVTAWLDPSSGNTDEGLYNEYLEAYHQLALNGQLTAHVVATVVANVDESAVSQIITLKQLQTKFNKEDLLHVVGFKIFADGVLEYPTQTAAISSPYKNSGTHGSLMVDPKKLSTFITFADRNKLMVHIHAIGDRAVTVSLDGFEAARIQNHTHAQPHSITHLQLVKSSDFARFNALNVLPCMQLLWATADRYTEDLVKPYISTSLYKNHYPAQSLANAGAIVCGASDWPVSSANPFEAISIAETRKGDMGILNENEIMTRDQMLKAYTIHAAKALRIDTLTGTIEAGKFADLILVDRDLTAVDAESIRNAKILWTMFEGRIVYDSTIAIK